MRGKRVSVFKNSNNFTEKKAWINIYSINGLKGGSPTIAYYASKFAVPDMTKTSVIELAPYSIRVNSIHSGVILTPMVQ